MLLDRLDPQPVPRQVRGDPRGVGAVGGQEHDRSAGHEWTSDYTVIAADSIHGGPSTRRDSNSCGGTGREK